MLSRFVAVVLFLLPTTSQASYIIYSFDDERTGSQLAGWFEVNTDLLATTASGNKLLTFAGVGQSQFNFWRFSGGTEENSLVFKVVGVSDGGVEIDPETGKVLSDGFIYFGPSQHIISSGGTDYYVSGGQATFDTRSYVIDHTLLTGSLAELNTTFSTSPGGTSVAYGHWDARVTAAPAPPALLLGLLGILGLIPITRRRQSSSELAPQ
jgi:hypothetical protein